MSDESNKSDDIAHGEHRPPQRLPPGTRLVFVFEELELGGAERQALVLARSLAREQRAEVQVWGFGPPGAAAELCEQYGLVWRQVGRPSMGTWLGTVKRMAQFALALRRFRPAVILPYTFFPNVACGLVWKWTGARSCFWNQRDVIEYRLGRGIDRWAIKQIPVFVANARHTAEFLAAYLGAPAQRIHVVHNGVELAPPQASRQVWRQRLQVNEAAFVACMVANLSSIKDHATLLRAWRVVCDRLGREGRQPLLVLAGRPADATASLKPLAAELRLGESVCFLGFEPDIAGLLGAVEAGVFCSHRESFPNGVLEGMAMGLPVVATDLPATREALGDPGQAWLAPPGDASVLADKICALAQDPALRRRLGGLNQERVQDHFSPQQMTRRMTALMGQVLRGQPEEMNRG